MGSWEAFDSFQTFVTQQQQAHLTQPPGPPSDDFPIQNAPPHPSTKIPSSVQSSLSLGRYMQLLALLCGGPTPETGAWIVRQLGELERAAVKMEDLKSVLNLNGYVAGAKNKQEVLDKMRGMELLSPICNIPATLQSAGVLAMASARAQKMKLEEGMKRALEWVGATPHQIATASASISRQNFYSFCPLPETEFLPLACAIPNQGIIITGSAPQPATSATTIASLPSPRLRLRIADDSVANPVNPEDAIMPDVDQINDSKSFLFAHAPPPWLLPSLEKLMISCKGSSDAAVGPELVGRKVALVMPEKFEQDGNGAVDTLDRGVHLGQVVEWIGGAHDEDSCPADCIQEHCFCFVRVTPTSSTAPVARRGRRRLDLAVDLREEFRLAGLEELLQVDKDRLADAWVSVVPKEDI